MRGLIFWILFLTCEIAVRSETYYLTPDTIMLTGEINKNSSSSFIKQFRDTKSDPFVYIDSIGGFVYYGHEIITEMVTSQKNVTCFAKMASSISFDIFQMCTNRYVMIDSELFQHSINYTVTGTLEDIIKQLEQVILIDTMNDLIDLQIAFLMDYSFDEYRNKLKNNLFVKGGNEILKYNLADKLVKLVIS
jgi:ATP-dependent protease ClpP protease subunit